MDQIGVWFSATIDHLKQHWSKHILPFFALFFGILLVAGLAFGAFFLSTLLFGAIGSAFDDDAITGMMGALGMAVGGFLGFLFTLLLPPLFLAHVRLILMLERGDPEARYALGWAYKRLLAVVMVMLGKGFLNGIGVLLCFVGVYLTGALTYVALPALADRDQGGVDALSTALALGKANILPLVVFMFGLAILNMVLMFVPFVGGFLAFVVNTAAPVIVYEKLREGADAVA